MNPKEKRVGRILAVKRRLSLQAKGELAKAQHDMMKAAQHEQRCEQRETAFGAALTGPGAHSGAEMLGALELFELARSERQKARALLDEAEGMVRARRESAVALEREIKSLEKVSARLREVRLRQQARREQTAQDEMAARVPADSARGEWLQ